MLKSEIAYPVHSQPAQYRVRYVLKGKLIALKLLSQIQRGYMLEKQTMLSKIMIENSGIKFLCRAVMVFGQSESCFDWKNSR